MSFVFLDLDESKNADVVIVRFQELDVHYLENFDFTLVKFEGALFKHLSIWGLLPAFAEFLVSTGKRPAFVK